MPNALVEWLGDKMRSFFGIRTNFGMPIIQINRQNLAKSTSNQRLGGLLYFVVIRMQLISGRLFLR